MEVLVCIMVVFPSTPCIPPAAAALVLSNIPWAGPLGTCTVSGRGSYCLRSQFHYFAAAVRVAIVNEEFVVNPSTKVVCALVLCLCSFSCLTGFSFRSFPFPGFSTPSSSFSSSSATATFIAQHRSSQPHCDLHCRQSRSDHSCLISSSQYHLLVLLSI